MAYNFASKRSQKSYDSRNTNTRMPHRHRMIKCSEKRAVDIKQSAEPPIAAFA